MSEESFEPTKKSPAIDAFITEVTGVDRQATIRGGKCAMGCNPPNLEFRTHLDKREYEISGLCQSCQDKVFGGPNDDGDI